jgi:hypothetical protein
MTSEERAVYYEAQAQRIEAEKVGEAAMDALGNLVNGAGLTARNAFVKQFHHQHRTLQQGIIRMMADVMLDLASVGERGPGWFDLRNQGAVEFCRKVKPEIDAACLPFI